MCNMMTNKQINLVIIILKNTFDIIVIRKKTKSFKRKSCTLYNDKEDRHEYPKTKSMYMC